MSLVKGINAEIKEIAEVHLFFGVISMCFKMILCQQVFRPLALSTDLYLIVRLRVQST